MKDNVILVAVDSTHRSLSIVKQAAMLAIRLQKALYLVHVVDTKEWPGLAAQRREESLARYFNRNFYKVGTELGVKHVISTVIYGNPSKRLTKLSNLNNVAMIIMGASGRHCIGSLSVMGHTTMYVTRWSKKNAIIVREPAALPLPLAAALA
ncbi:universal stress protein [Lactiplantibacillus herbarum]|uniref:universal stress protein n=1 Tax=Lactiplantibacillus herbarum TaxID=1670446 RepID=UPI00064E9679|nr:universal stress protein [Lactiplantibacillus herbarum]